MPNAMPYVNSEFVRISEHSISSNRVSHTSEEYMHASDRVFIVSNTKESDFRMGPCVCESFCIDMKEYGDDAE